MCSKCGRFVCNCEKYDLVRAVAQSREENNLKAHHWWENERAKEIERLEDEDFILSQVCKTSRSLERWLQSERQKKELDALESYHNTGRCIMVPPLISGKIERPPRAWMI